MTRLNESSGACARRLSDEFGRLADALHQRGFRALHDGADSPEEAIVDTVVGIIDQALAAGVTPAGPQ